MIAFIEEHPSGRVGRRHSGTVVSQNSAELVNIRAESQLGMLCKGSTPRKISSRSREWDALDRRSAGCAPNQPSREDQPFAGM